MGGLFHGTGNQSYRYDRRWRTAVRVAVVKRSILPSESASQSWAGRGAGREHRGTPRSTNKNSSKTTAVFVILHNIVEVYATNREIEVLRPGRQTLSCQVNWATRVTTTLWWPALYQIKRITTVRSVRVLRALLKQQAPPAVVTWSTTNRTSTTARYKIK